MEQIRTMGIEHLERHLDQTYNDMYIRANLKESRGPISTFVNMTKDEVLEYIEFAIEDNAELIAKKFISIQSGKFSIEYSAEDKDVFGKIVYPNSKIREAPRMRICFEKNQHSEICITSVYPVR